MLVVRRPEGLLLIEQMEHARLVGALAAQWGNRQFPPALPRDAVGIAAALHDKGWEVADAQPLFNAAQGRPTHFPEVPFDDHVRLYQPGVEEVTRIDPYAGLLVGMHWIGLYRQRWGRQPASAAAPADPGLAARVDAVVTAEECRWVELKKQLWPQAGRRSEFEARVWTNYELLQVWDVLSLSLCMMPLDVVTAQGTEPVRTTSVLSALEHEPRARLVGPVPTTAEGHTLDLEVSVVAPTVVAVHPYPFASASVPMWMQGRLIPDRAYATQGEVREAVEHARPCRMEFTITPRS
jgi:hypothetical protein